MTRLKSLMKENAKTFDEIQDFNKGVKKVKSMGLTKMKKQQLIHQKNNEIDRLYKEIYDLRQLNRSLNKPTIQLAILKCGAMIKALKEQISLIQAQK